MHPNPVFRTAGRDRNLAFARDRAFGMLAVADDAAPLLSHVPFVLSEAGGHADLHLVRSNPIIRVLARPRPARIAVSGPDSYVSPDWYGAEDQVPTWNYVAVHLTGLLELRPVDELPALLDRQSARFEERLQPKPPWTTAKMTPDALDRMMRVIVPCRLRIEAVDGTWKLNQNKAEAERLRAAEAVAKDGIGHELQALAQLMREV